MAEALMNEQKKPPFRLHNARVIICVTIGMLLLLGAFAYTHVQTAHVSRSLEKKIEALSQVEQQNNLAIKQSISELQEADQRNRSLAAQQESIIAEWRSVQKSDLDKWHVAEAQYLTKSANLELQLGFNIPLASILLKNADKELEGISVPSVVEIRKAIANDLSTLKSIPLPDITNIYLQLVSIDTRIDKLPLPPMPLSPDLKPGFDADTRALPWWKAGLIRTKEALKQVVIIRYNDNHTLPLVSPEEKRFLYQNLHAEIQTLIWALLHHDVKIYQTSLVRVIEWIEKYFAQTEPLTQMMLHDLTILRDVNLEPNVSNLSMTLSLFDNYLNSEPQPATTRE